MQLSAPLQDFGMQSQVIHWTAYFQALSLPLSGLIVASLAGWIVYQQWMTAKAQVVLDLFEKRLEAYDLITAPLFEILRIGSSSVDGKMQESYLQGLLKAKFLFGPEVVDYLDNMWVILRALKANVKSQASASGTKLESLHEQEEVYFAEILRFHDTFDQMVMPYMRVSTKIIEKDFSNSR